MSILSPVTGNDIADSLLVRQVQTFFEKKVNQEGERILSRHGSRVNSINRQSEPWERLKDRLTEPLKSLDRVVGRLQSIRATIDSLIKTVENANEDADADANPAGYKATFDGLMKSFRNYAENTPDTPNLLGRDPSAQLTFPINSTNAQQTFNGTYFGTDYYITDSNGDRWQPNRVSGQLVRFDSFPDEPSTTKAAINTGIRLDSFDESTGAVDFTINAATAAIESVSGTVTREGLHVLDAWLYDDLGSQEGRDRALADLESAQTLVDLEIRRYEVAANTIDFHRQRATLNIEGFEKEREAVLARQAQELVDARDELDRQFRVTQESLRGSIALRKQYSVFFLGQTNDPFISALIDINV